ncbi:MAG: peptide chain release factor 1 [Bacteroidota bacterium]
MQKQFKNFKNKLKELETLLGESSIAQDSKRFIKLSKEHKEMSKIVDKIEAYEQNQELLVENQEIFRTEKDEAFLLMAKEEKKELEATAIQLEKELKRMLVPADPNDSKDIILELRAGTGGNEAAIWVGDLFRMYHRFIDLQGWQLTIADFTAGSSGGYKEIIATVSGHDVYGQLKYESGVHRVQRVPATETQGRLHTSAASVVVLPEVDDVEVHIDMKEVKKETFCSSGPGGQSVNTTYSAVRLTHMPSGIVVSCQDEKSQIKNYDKALKVLRARLYEQALKEQQDSISQERKSIVGSQDRSAKIRTYNYPRSAVTDHRIHYTNHNLPGMLDGNIGEIIEALRVADHAARVKNQ